MEGRRENEPGERGRRRLNTRSVIALLCAIAVAGAIGIVLSLGQHTAAPVARPAPTQLGPLPITPTPMPDSPQSGAGFSVAADLATHQVVLFGGVGDYPNTWLWNGSAWTLAHPATSPQGRFGASAAYDPETKTVVLFGGRLEAGTPVHDTWAWNGITWTDLDSGAGGPPPGEGSDMAWDEATSQMVLITSSGVISNPAETWVWAGTHWIHPAGAVLPAGADYSPMSFDPVSKSLLAVGCCVGPPPATGAVSTTWRWTGATWALLPTPGVAPINGSSMELDPAEQAPTAVRVWSVNGLGATVLGMDWDSLGAVFDAPTACGHRDGDQRRRRVAALWCAQVGIRRASSAGGRLGADRQVDVVATRSLALCLS